MFSGETKIERWPWQLAGCFANSFWRLFSFCWLVAAAELPPLGRCVGGRLFYLTGHRPAQRRELVRCPLDAGTRHGRGPRASGGHAESLRIDRKPAAIARLILKPAQCYFASSAALVMAKREWVDRAVLRCRIACSAMAAATGRFSAPLLSDFQARRWPAELCRATILGGWSLT